MKGSIQIKCIIILTITLKADWPINACHAARRRLVQDIRAAETLDDGVLQNTTVDVDSVLQVSDYGVASALTECL